MIRKILVSTVICIGLILALAVVFVRHRSSTGFSEVDPAISSFVTGGNRNDSFGSYSPLVLNVSTCEKGRDSAYYGLGHAEFLSEGKTKDACVFKYGSEVENPNWDGKLRTSCSVPTGQDIKLAIADGGIDFTPIKQYCYN